MGAQFWSVIEALKTTWIWPGFVEVGQFLGTHLISGMFPAFLIAGAIATFLDKRRITQYMGPHANPWISFPMAAFSGALLTVCSCGVVPIFTGILTSGAGVGPAFTFLFAAPALNLIAMTYTFSIMGTWFLVGRILSVLFCALVIGLFMRWFHSKQSSDVPTPVVMADVAETRTDGQTLAFFVLLVVVMLTSTGIFDSRLEPLGLPFLQTLTGETISRSGLKIIFKLLLLIGEALIGTLMLWRWFCPDEVWQWLRKAGSLFWMIFPKVLLGIFLSGMLAAVFPLSRYMTYFDNNTVWANVMISLIGALSYFGTIVGVNVTATLVHFGMNHGPAMAFLLSGPAVSLPEIIALIPIMGRQRAITYLILVVITTTICGLVFGALS